MPWCPPRPSTSPAPLYFPFVLPLSHHIFRNLSARRPVSRTAGPASPFQGGRRALSWRPRAEAPQSLGGGAWGRRGCLAKLFLAPAPEALWATCGFLPAPRAKLPLFLTTPRPPCTSPKVLSLVTQRLCCLGCSPSRQALGGGGLNTGGRRGGRPGGPDSSRKFSKISPSPTWKESLPRLLWVIVLQDLRVCLPLPHVLDQQPPPGLGLLSPALPSTDPARRRTAYSTNE